MSRHDLEQFAARWAAAITTGRGIEDLLAKSIDPSPFLARAAAMRARIGPFQVVVDDVICEGDRIAWRWTLRSAESVVHGVNFQRIEDGRAVEHWTLSA